MSIDYYVRTQYDGKDYMSVEEIYYFDEGGEEKVSKEATDCCIDISTCADQGVDLWSWLRRQVRARLKEACIPHGDIWFEDEPN